MRREIKIIGWMLGLSLVGFAQPCGEKAIGVIGSKDGLLAASIRLASPGNPYLNLAFTAGIDRGKGLTGGISIQQYFGGGVCGGAACRRGSVYVSPYMEGGVRLRRPTETTAQLDVLGHLGLGLLLPIGPVETFAQANLYSALSPMQPRFDIAGGIRIRF